MPRLLEGFFKKYLELFSPVFSHWLVIGTIATSTKKRQNAQTIHPNIPSVKPCHRSPRRPSGFLLPHGRNEYCPAWEYRNALRRRQGPDYRGAQPGNGIFE